MNAPDRNVKGHGSHTDEEHNLPIILNQPNLVTPSNLNSH